jgi:dimethylglycine dehydrogenase
MAGAHLPKGLTLRDRTREMSTLIVTGPASRALFAAISDADLTRPWLSHDVWTVAGHRRPSPASPSRANWAGRSTPPVDSIPAIHAAVLEAGAKPFGMWALNSLRLEKAYRAWKGDLSTDYSLLEAGLDRFVRSTSRRTFPARPPFWPNGSAA